MNWILKITLVSKEIVQLPVQDHDAAYGRVNDIGEHGFTVAREADANRGFRYYPPNSIDFIDAVPRD